MTLEVELSPGAQQDLTDIALFLVHQAGPAIAHRVLDAINAAIDHLAQYPGSGVLRDFGEIDLNGLRMWPVWRYPNYLIFYQSANKTLTIRRVLHGAQDVQRIFHPH